MTYEVKTAVFEGPLDLLLQLITQHQVDITHLSITELVSEYLTHLDAMQEMDMEVTSEFLLIAATLIQLKARFLLPEDADMDIDEELALFEERDRLLARLLACATFKDVAAVLAHRPTTRCDPALRRATDARAHALRADRLADRSLLERESSSMVPRRPAPSRARRCRVTR